MSISNEVRYLASHEWGRIDEEGILTVGISEHAQDLLGDIVFVEFPNVGDTFNQNDIFGTIEAVKTLALQAGMRPYTFSKADEEREQAL